MEASIHRDAIWLYVADAENTYIQMPTIYDIDTIFEFIVVYNRRKIFAQLMILWR